MRKTILTMLGSALLAGSLAQAAVAVERHHGRTMHHWTAPISESARNASASWSSPWAQPDWSRYEGGAVSAPAGH
jgi:hypothetical protein